MVRRKTHRRWCEKYRTVPLFYTVVVGFNVVLICLRNATTSLGGVNDIDLAVPIVHSWNQTLPLPKNSLDFSPFPQQKLEQWRKEQRQVPQPPPDGQNLAERQRQSYEVCFVTSVFAPSPDSGDRPPSVEGLKKSNPDIFGFFAFTNIPQLDAPGWTITIQNDLKQYRRYITQSRHAKFLAWQDDKIQQSCQVVFYIDGYCQPKEKHVELYRSIAKKIATNSTFGLAQNKHMYTLGVMHELDRIVEKQKDIAENVEATIKWLRNQPDFRENCTMYENHYLAYSPKSSHFQEASTFFWDHYSLEQDSWRDQPLWCYVLDKYNITPMPLGDPKKLFWERWKHMAPDGHRYNKKKDNDANNNGRLMQEWSK